MPEVKIIKKYNIMNKIVKRTQIGFIIIIYTYIIYGSME